MTQSTAYTAAQIARALGKKRQAVQRLLLSVPSETIPIAGNMANAWPIHALPRLIQEQLSDAARRHGYRNSEALLSAPAVQWQPPTPIGNVRAEFISRALKLRDALTVPIAKQHDLPPGELIELGLAEFQRVFGYSIGVKQWSRLFDRTILRDRGFEQYDRAELYLDEAAFRSPIAKVAVFSQRFDLTPISEAVGMLENKERPTTDDRAHLFHAAFSHFEALRGDGDRRQEIEAKASVIAFLFSSVPGLSKSVNGLRRVFEMKLNTWRSNGRTVVALRDGRELGSGNFRDPLCDDCRHVLLTIATAHDGNESMAYRLARRDGLLCAKCGSHSFDARHNKSAMPKVIRSEITPLVDAMLPLHRGPKEARMCGPYIPRNWDGVLPGDWFSADDITWNHYFRHTDASGRTELIRGECLLMIDLRTGYPLDFSLIAGNYNSEHIRGLILSVHDCVGLPVNGFYFERGTWKARLIGGDTSQGTPIQWRDTELGLREHGLDLQVRHATTPRAKTIEGLIHILQDRMRSIPGFVGFNERTDRRERVQQTINAARAGNSDAMGTFPTQQEWRDQIRAVLNEFAHDPQNGKMLDGATPAEMFNAQTAKRPFKQLPESARFIIATHRKTVRVRQEGIVITIRGKRHLYANSETGALIGHDVMAHYNVESPDLLTVCDMKREHFFSVKRVELPAMSATTEQFAQVNEQVRGHRAAAKVLYGNIRHDFVATIARDGDHDEATRAFGKFHNEAVANHGAEKTERDRKARKMQTAAAAAGVAIPAHIRNPDRVIEGIAMEKEIRARIAAREQESA